jgi:transposase
MIQRLLHIIHTLLFRIQELELALRKKQEKLDSKSEMLYESELMLTRLMNENDSFEKEIITLKRRLAAAEKKEIRKTSSNSNLPPSKDAKKQVRKNYNSRKKSGRKTGGQPGHKGYNLNMKDNPNVIIDLIPKTCSNCDKALNPDNKVYVDARQIIDIPPSESIVYQYNRYLIECVCGATTLGKYPNSLVAKVQYGIRLRAFIVYMMIYQFLPYKRLQEFIATCFGISLSQGTIANILTKTANQAKPAYAEIRDHIEKSDIVGADEGFISVNGKTAYFWVWQNSMATFIASEANREGDNIYKHFPNGFPFAVIISDRYASHLSTPAKAHQICWVHLLRHLKYLKQAEKNPWLFKFEKIFNRAKAMYGKKDVWDPDNKRVKKLEADFDRLLDKVVDKKKFPETETLRNSMIKNRKSLFNFLYYEGVPFHNNDSERAIRNAKIKIKISGFFKSGQQDYAIIRSVVDTLIKNEKPIFESLYLLHSEGKVDLGFAR